MLAVLLVAWDSNNSRLTTLVMSPVRLPDAWVSLSSPQLEKRRTVVGKPTTPEGLVLEAWSQGFMVGSIIMLAFITTANMRKGVLLHKVRTRVLILRLRCANIGLFSWFYSRYTFINEPIACNI